ncbi:MAG TPA: AAA family ATPase [Pyrinomonadaceae bacterium]
MRKTENKALRFTRIHLENWRNFTQADAELQRRVFLVGPNASGKSNLLDVFRFLKDIASVGGGFQEALRRRQGVSRLRSLAARKKPDIRICAHIGNDENPIAWAYELSFTQDKQRHALIKSERVSRNGIEILNRPDEKDQSDPERLVQTHLEQVYANQEFRDVSDFFASVRYFHIVPQLVREPDRSVGKQNDPYGGDFLEQIARTPENTQKARLRRIVEALRVAVPQLVDLELERDIKGAPHLRGKYEHWRSQGAWQTEEQFSDGTLRLMGLLWTALDGSGPLLLEEPELSLHPDVVRFIPQMFARIQRRYGRQVLLSTHSPDMLRDQGIGLDEVLLLLPENEGTNVRAAGTFTEVKELLAGGLSLPDAILPRTRPRNVEQLSFSFVD